MLHSDMLPKKIRGHGTVRYGVLSFCKCGVFLAGGYAKPLTGRTTLDAYEMHKAVLLADLAATRRREVGEMEPGDRMMKTSEIAKMFGVKSFTVVSWITGGKLPGVRVNRRWYAKCSDVQALAESKYGERSYK